MLSKPIQDAINSQIQKEFESAYLYLGMAAHFDANNLPGFAHWMRKQFGEEQGHALRFYDYVYDQRGEVTLQAIAAPTGKFGKPVEIFQQVLAHEQKVTASIIKVSPRLTTLPLSLRNSGWELKRVPRVLMWQI